METKIRKAINENITSKEIYSQEFQDKYFLHKQIKRALPEYSDDILFQTINICNEKIKSPSRKNRFVDVFSKTLTRLSRPEEMIITSRSDNDWP
jgi:hypothetical protein